MAQTKTVLKDLKLSMAGMIERVRETFSSLPDARKNSPNLQYTVADAALAAFSVFFFQFPSFLSYQRAMEEKTGRNNARSLFGVPAIPTDNTIRNILDPVSPEKIYPVLAEIGDRLKAGGYLDEYRTPLGFLVPLDGTQTFFSEKLSCKNGTNKTHADGTVTHHHSAITPVLVVPGQSRVIALPPEFVNPQDGATKQDCEIRAASRWIENQGSHYAPWGVTLLGDDLYSREPFCQKAIDAGFSFLFVCKESSHKTLYEYLKDSCETKVEHRVEGKRKIRRETDTYRFMTGAPIKDGKEALAVNWFSLTTTDSFTGKVLYSGAWITSHPVDAKTVVLMARCARARWKVENENNNVLKTKGYNLEHNFGHGKEHLSDTLTTLNILSFLLHTALEFVDLRYRTLRSLSPRQELFNALKYLTSRFFFKSWDYLMAVMLKEEQLVDSG